MKIETLLLFIELTLFVDFDWIFMSLLCYYLLIMNNINVEGDPKVSIVTFYCFQTIN